MALTAANQLRRHSPAQPLPEQAFRKFCPIEAQFSRTRFLAGTTDGRWVIKTQAETETINPRQDKMSNAHH
ncbi:hypothetical protein [Bradyrhizobium sp. AUGA SZCCT0431]|uniref:hypothetical protein n=1 Tax=Bradyrhizobium sp. AUGA SZCCT0431 TaxID=2807674 RepID=UPI001BA91F6D|nr:hypothetical protein [Bradyrhizobium sp. AUGA SZCCT0431]